VLDDFGLIPALRGLLEDFARRTRIDVALEGGEGLRPFTPDQEVVIYRVVQEALTNVARHAQARHVRVALAADGDRLRLAVEDDGRGSAGPPQPHLGLLGMRERVLAVGGSIDFRGTPGKGFRLDARIPMGAVA
jgi:signal transduction histidine kinase